MASFQSINPVDGTLIRSFDELKDDMLAHRLHLAREGFDRWRRTSIKKRSEKLLEVAGILDGKKQQLGRLITLEMGKPLKEAIGEIEKCAWVCRYYAENAEDFLEPRRVKTDAKNSMVRFDPIGAVLAIMPWNFPFWQVFRFAAPTLTAGNVGLLKHASNVPQCALAIEEIFAEADYPDGVFQNLFISSRRVGEVLDHPIVKATTLTGSGRAGSAVASQSGERLMKSVLELGGTNSFIVLEDADMNLALEKGTIGRFQNTGQSCIAAKRFIIHESVYDKFRDGIVSRTKSLQQGNPLDEVDLGPLARVDLAEELEDQVNRSVEKGAQILTGGNRNGAFYSPTVLDGVKPGMAAFDEELFGPVVSLVRATDLNHAIELSNRSTFGLGVSVITKNEEQIAERLQDFEDGAVFINEIVKSDPRLPFGGTKESGFGRELGPEGIREFVNVKTVYFA